MKEKKMQELEKKYEKLKEQFLKISYICIGSINTVYTKCGNDYCICSKDETKKHGPYYLWTRKNKGKTISIRLSKNQVRVCKKFIDNNKKLKDLITKMIDVSVEIVKIS